MNGKVEKLFQYLIIVVVFFFTLRSASIVISDAFSFDGGMNAQAAHNLIKDSSPRADYQGMSIFDPKIQTGIPVILPVAINFLLFGESFSSGLTVNAVYLIILVIAVIYYFKTCLKINNLFTFLVILVLYATPSLFDYGFGLYGEIPAIFYFILSLIFLHKYRDGSRLIYILLSGSFLGLGYLTKTVILITIPAFVLVAILDRLFNSPNRIKRLFQSQGLFMLGFIAPITIFEIFKLAFLGVESYGKWWNTMVTAVLMQAGVSEGFADTSGIATKFIAHLDLLSSYLITNKWIIVFSLGFLIISYMAILLRFVNAKKNQEPKGEFIEKSTSLDFIVLLTVTLCYFGWWLLITPTQKAWHRRIINGTILLDICVMVIFYFIYDYFFQKSERPNNQFRSYRLKPVSDILILLVSVISLVYIFGSDYNDIAFKDTKLKVSSVNAGEFVRNLPKDAIIFGVGWWQAPIISFTSGRDFFDVHQNQLIAQAVNNKERYLVIDSYSYVIDPGASETVLNKYKNQLTFSESNIYIYKLIKWNP